MPVAIVLHGAAARERMHQRPTPRRPCPHAAGSFEFLTREGLHVAMSTAVQRGNLYVCGVSAGAARWDGAKDAAKAVVRSFRLRSAAG